MAEIKSIEVTGEELQRRIRVVLEYGITETEAMFNQELAKRIAELASLEWIKRNKKKLLKTLDDDDIGKRVIRAIVAKAVFNLAVEHANESH